MSNIAFDPAAILLDVARRLNVPNFAANTNITASQATYWLVQAQRALSARLQSTFGDDRDFVKEVQLLSQPNLSAISLPQSCVAVYAVVWEKTPTDFRLLKQMQAADIVRQQTQTAGSWFNEEPTWRLEGNTIDILPPMDTAQIYTVFFSSYLINNGSATFLSRLEADDWITLRVCINASQAKRRDDSQYRAAMAELETKLFATSRKRNHAGPARVRDVYGGGNGGDCGGGYGGGPY